MNIPNIKKFKLFLFNKNEIKILILTHPHPDGDALGSVLSLFLFIKNFHDNVKIIITHDYESFFTWIPGVKNIDILYKNLEALCDFIKTADYIFFIDFNKYARMEPVYSEFIKHNSAIKILIDHHVDPDKFDIMYSYPKAASTTLILYNIICNLGYSNLINKNIATLLYIGLVTDTDYFRYSNINKNVYDMLHFISDKKINFPTINNKIYQRYKIYHIKLLGKILYNIQILTKYRTVFMVLTYNDMIKYKLRDYSSSEYVNYGLKIKNIILSILLIEKEKSIIKISFRSIGNFDVNYLAKTYFNGGGHKNASGGVYYDTLINTMKYIKSIVINYYNNY
jgi:phosphoesterase RecJ-like protein